MMQRLRATTERVQRSAARGACPAGAGFLGTDNATVAWNVEPMVHTTAICTFGKYHTRRLQEMPT